MPTYTHSFKLEFDGAVYEGEIEFNTDGVASYQFNEVYSFTLEQMETINLLMGNWHRLFKAFGDTIKLVRLKENT